MAQTTYNDFQIYQEQFHTGLTEWLQQNSNVFNAASRNGMRFVTQNKIGEYEKEAFFESIASVVRRRDPTSVATVTDKQLTEAEKVSVKINRGLGPVLSTKDAFRKIGMSPEAFSLTLGRQFGPAVAVDYANTALIAAVAALRSQASVVRDESTATGAATLRHTYLASTLAKFGDAAGRIVCWVMHSKVYWDLVKQSITDNVFQIGGLSVREGRTETLGIPTVITDSSALTEASASGDSTYFILGLTENGVVITQSEESDIESDLVTGQENLAVRIQGEHAYNVGIKGFTWSTTGGGVNPTDAALGTVNNWSLVSHDVKLGAGVMLITD